MRNTKNVIAFILDVKGNLEKLKKLFFLSPAFIWALSIFALSINDGIQLPQTGIELDKIGHFGAYAVLNSLVLWGFWKLNYMSKSFLWVAFICVAAFGVGLEFVQLGFFPHRYFEVWDIIANIIGAFTSSAVFYFFITKT